MIGPNKRLWRIASTLVIALSVLSFTPLVLDPTDPDPRLFGMPHTLWASMAVAFAIVLLTYLGARVHPETGEEAE